MKIRDYPEHTRPYVSHGLDLSEVGDQYQADCPFCDKEQHFYISKETGQFDCKVCGEVGNQYTFLKGLHSVSLEMTREEDLEELSQMKGISTKVLKTHKLALSTLSGNWLIPSYNRDSKLSNVYLFNSATNSLISTSGCKQHLYLVNQFVSSREMIWIAEGHWDCMVLDHCLRVTKRRKEVNLLAVPGASTFKREWLDLLEDRKVCLFFDNDIPKQTKTRVVQPGLDGMRRLYKLAKKNGVDCEMFVLNWEIEEGKDVKDVFQEMGVV